MTSTEISAATTGDQRAENAAAELVKEIHGDGACHICGKPKAGLGLLICSYPHGMVPERAIDPLHPEGFWTWREPSVGEASGLPPDR